MKRISGIKRLFAAALLFAGFSASAQNSAADAINNYDQGFRLGFALNGGYMFNPSDTGFGRNGDADIFAGPVVGADVRLQYDLTKRLSLTLTTGYNHIFIDQDLDNLGYNDIGMIPVKVGFKAFFWEDSFYGLAEVGAGFTTNKNTPFGTDTNVILAPGIGWASKYIDLSLRYEHYTEFESGQVALRLAYGFKL